MKKILLSLVAAGAVASLLTPVRLSLGEVAAIKADPLGVAWNLITHVQYWLD